MDRAEPAPPFKTTLAELARHLDGLGVSYYVTGSVAVFYYGRPRYTHDIDLVALIRQEDVARLSVLLPEDHVLDEVGAARAAAEGEHFNTIDLRTGIKVDFWPLAPTAYARSAMGRRRRVPFNGGEVWMSSVEDLILSKLLWFLETGREPKHWDDVLGVIEVSGDEIDPDYLRRWAAALGIHELVAEALVQARPAQG
jgi:hypothetical protein